MCMYFSTPQSNLLLTKQDCNKAHWNRTNMTTIYIYYTNNTFQLKIKLNIKRLQQNTWGLLVKECWLAHGVLGVLLKACQKWDDTDFILVTLIILPY